MLRCWGWRGTVTMALVASRWRLRLARVLCAPVVNLSRLSWLRVRLKCWAVLSAIARRQRPGHCNLQQIFCKVIRLEAIVRMPLLLRWVAVGLCH